MIYKIKRQSLNEQNQGALVNGLYRWQDKLTGSSVSLDDVWKWRVIVIAWCEEGGYSKL